MKRITLNNFAGHAQRGFTLVEIMVVVIIISILTALVAPGVMNRLGKAQVTAVQSDLKAIESALQLYKLDNFKYPTTGEGLKVLVNDSGKRTWSGPYLPKMPKDPWKNDYQYQYPGTKNPNGFDVWSMGADGSAGGEGEDQDLGNWEESN